MNSLLGYGSDDDLDDSPEEKHMESHGSSRNYRRQGLPRQDDTNYDEVQMSLSEDSDSELKNARDVPRPSRERDNYRRDESRRNSSPKRDDRSRDEDRPRYRDRDDKVEDRSRSRDDDKRGDRYRSEKEDERSRERRDEKRGKSRERYSSSSRDDRSNRDRKDRFERRRSRSPKDRRRRSRSPRRNDRSRSRSRSRDRNDRSDRGSYFKRYDRLRGMRFDNRSDFKSENSQSETQKAADDSGLPKDRFFMPGITGRFREQIEKRKLLWQKNKEPEKQVPTQVKDLGGTRTTKVWETTTFAQDNDGKVANKFKRLMGIKNVGEGSNSATEVLKKQEEMFSSMEAQYEVARTATHTMRGVGLGFGSYQR